MTWLRCGFLVVLGVPCAAEETLSLRARLIGFEVHGDVESGDDDERFVRGKTRSVREDFGLKRSIWISGEFSVRVGERNRIRAGALYGAVRGDRAVDEPFDWNDNQYVVGEKLDQEVSYGHFALAWQHRIVSGSGAELWAGAGLAYTNTNVALRVRRAVVPHADQDDGERIKTLFPTVNLDGTADLGSGFEAFGSVGAGAFGIDVFDESGDGRFAWISAGVRWHAASWLSVEAALDFIWTRTTFRGREAGGGDFDIIRYELRLLGPSVGLTVRF